MRILIFLSLFLPIISNASDDTELEEYIESMRIGAACYPKPFPKKPLDPSAWMEEVFESSEPMNPYALGYVTNLPAICGQESAFKKLTLVYKKSTLLFIIFSILKSIIMTYQQYSVYAMS
jgi:hypothetical protein